jgi:5'-nucleotidase
MLGAAAVAFSQATGGALDFTRAARHCRAVLEVLLAGGLESGHLINVNIPVLQGPAPLGICVARQSVAAVEERYARRQDIEGREHFQLTDWFGFRDPPDESDVVAVERGFISVTPLHVDLTDASRLERLEKLPWAAAMGRIDAQRRAEHRP